MNIDQRPGPGGLCLHHRPPDPPRLLCGLWLGMEPAHVAAGGDREIRVSMNREQRAEWITMGPEPWLATCGRCGVRIKKPELPMNLAEFIRRLRVVADLHSGCRERLVTP